MTYDPHFLNCHFRWTVWGDPLILPNCHVPAQDSPFNPFHWKPPSPLPDRHPSPFSNWATSFLEFTYYWKRLISIYFLRSRELNIYIKIWHEPASPSVRLINTWENYFRNPQTVTLNITGWVDWGGGGGVDWKVRGKEKGRKGTHDVEKPLWLHIQETSLCHLHEIRLYF